jgi:flagellar hook-associated protein 3 FlgL
MRIATNTVIESSLVNLQGAQSRLLDAQQAVSTGKSLNEPSDNPAALSQDLSLRTTLDNLDQYTRNLDDAKGFVGLTDTALGQLTTMLRNARQLAIQGANGTLDSSTRDGLADQAKQISVEVAQIANSTYGPRFIFGGQRTTQPPYTPDSNGSYQYQGGSQPSADDNLTVTIGETETVVINVSGDRIFDKPFKALSDLQSHLANGQLSTISNSDLAAIDDALKTVTSIHAEFGSNAQRIQQAADRVDQKKTSLQTVLTQLEDADLPKAILELQTSQMSYQASLTAVSRTFQNSLLDFLH